VVTPAAGAVVLVPFRFSNLAQAKLFPAVILTDAGRGDWILCQVTSNPYADPHSIEPADSSIAQGSLRIISHARPGKLFTASQELMVSQAGTISTVSLQAIVESVTRILRSSLLADMH
jgi:mRNA interferase MazF